MLAHYGCGGLWEGKGARARAGNVAVSRCESTERETGEFKTSPGPGSCSDPVAGDPKQRLRLDCRHQILAASNTG